MILMIWVGMVTSIVLYQEDNLITSQQVATENIEIIENTGDNEITNVTEETNEYDDYNYTKSEDDQEAENFFIEYRLERDKARSEQLDIYREMINNSNTDKTTKEEAQKKMLQLTEKMEKEMEIESLIRARGYPDALSYIHDQSVDVIVQTKNKTLSENDVAKIGDIIVKTTGFKTEDVTIIEKKVNEN